MARFDDCLAVILGNEGGVSNNPIDTGGLTNMGITQPVYDDYRAHHGLPLQPVTFVTLDEASAIYLASYWTPARGQSLEQPVDLCMLDMAVNSGVYRAARLLQQCVGVVQDGILGPKTLAAAAKVDPLKLAADYCSARVAFVQGIVAANPEQRIFLNGWINRINHIRHVCGIAGY